ncbi:MAG: putative DNA binding domain-containing protein [Clostridiales Family XIII bacterium]|jgi:ATP-dependent DNA helicase RecG|nr:putative DNA binding domain-containing protein [Clostridiales Family XIII bacterium]
MEYKESSTIELKREYTSKYLKSVSAFATYGDGKIYIGIDEETGTICGVADPVAVKLRIENAIHDSISPRPNYSLETVSIDGKEVVVLSVTRGDDPPYFYGKHVYSRADTSSAPIEKSEIRRLIMDAEEVGYEDLDSTQADLKFSILKKRLVDVIGIEEFNIDTLRTLGLYKNDAYNRAAQLLADKNEIKSSYTDIVRFGETESIFLERKTIKDCSLVKQFDEAMNFFDRWYHPYEEVAGAYRETRIYIPKDGFREALANAIIHRDFMIHSFIRIAMYENRIEITSPGSLPKGITKEDFLSGKVSVPRNRIIAGVFNRLDIIEMFATGIKRIRAEYEQFKEDPIFDVSESHIKVVLPKVSYSKKIVYNPISFGDNEALILRVLSDNGEMSRAELEDIVDLSRSRLTDLLKKLIDEEKVLRLGSARTTKYSIVE